MRRVLVVEDGPTLTHGGTAHGAGTVAALEAGAAELVVAATAIVDAFLQRYPAG